MGTEQYLLEREKQQGLKEGLQKGLKKGLKEGEHKKALAIAAELKKRDVSLEDITAITGLSIEEIEKLDLP